MWCSENRASVTSCCRWRDTTLTKCSAHCPSCPFWKVTFASPSGPGFSKPNKANPGLVRILISVFEMFQWGFCLHCLSFSFEFEWSQTIRNIRSEKHFYTRKISTWLTFDPGLTLTGFRTTPPSCKGKLQNSLVHSLLAAGFFSKGHLGAWP